MAYVLPTPGAAPRWTLSRACLRAWAAWRVQTVPRTGCGILRPASASTDSEVTTPPIGAISSDMPPLCSPDAADAHAGAPLGDARPPRSGRLRSIEGSWRTDAGGSLLRGSASEGGGAGCGEGVGNGGEGEPGEP